MVRLPRLSALRPGPERFSSRLHDPGVAARLGIALGIAFTLCFATGLISHWLQSPPSWAQWPSRPVNFYRLTQGVHVLSGIGSVPLLLAKLWTVYPRLFTRPALRSVGHGIERGFVLVLVGSATFQLVTGLFNVAATYPWDFSFRRVHYAVAWIAFGALAVHVGHQWSLARRSVATPIPRAEAGAGLTRRGFLGSVGLASAILVDGTAGQTVPLPDRLARWLSPFATHLPHVGPQGLPVRTSARAAGVLAAATDPPYRLVVTGAVVREVSLSLADLRAMEQSSAELPITCVEGWSATGRWSGVPLQTLVAAAGVAGDVRVIVGSLQTSGSYTESEVDAPHVRDPRTLLALDLNGAPLAPDHGAPCRLIAPNRPGVLQTKWVTRIEVLE